VLKESLLMAMCIRDMMQGNKKLAEKGLVEESLGYNAIAAGFQGQRHWTDQYPNGDTAEALLNSSFDWNGVREPLSSPRKRQPQRRGDADGPPADRHRPGVCRRAHLLVAGRG
jgi:hypothetical protein